MSGRSRSLATTLFFETQLLGMDEVPNRSIVDLEAPLGKLPDEPTQREVSFLHPVKKPNPMLSRDRLRLVPAHLARRNAARLSRPANPPDGRAGTNPKLPRRLAGRHSTLLNRRNHPLTQIKRIGSTHWMLASIPASTLNQSRTALGIATRFRLKSSRFSFGFAIDGFVIR